MAELLETWAVIVAAGSGTRLGADVPKAFIGLGGRKGGARPFGQLKVILADETEVVVMGGVRF